MYIKGLLCTRHSGIFSCHPHNNLVKQILTPTFYRSGSGGSKDPQTCPSSTAKWQGQDQRPSLPGSKVQVFPVLDLGNHSPPGKGNKHLLKVREHHAAGSHLQKLHQFLGGSEARERPVTYRGALGDPRNTFLPRLPHYLSVKHFDCL